MTTRQGTELSGFQLPQHRSDGTEISRFELLSALVLWKIIHQESRIIGWVPAGVYR